MRLSKTSLPMSDSGVSVETAGETIRIIDRLSPARFEMESTPAPTLDLSESEEMALPVDAVYTAEISSLRLPLVAQGYIRGETGEIIGGFGYETAFQGGGQAATIEFNTPLKMYLQTPRLASVETSCEEMIVEFGEAVEVQIGVRSNAEQPAGEISVTEAPEDLLTAISQFRSTIRTRTSERSYPTLRGHPPTIQVGDTLSVPDRVRPDTAADICIEVPPTVEAAYTAAPLAYYLSAAVQPGTDPRLVTSGGFEYPLERPLASAIRRVLTQTFVLDCYTRSAGLRPTKVAWHDELAELLPSGHDPALLFDLDPGELLERYLAVDYETVAPFVPEWNLTAYVAPDAKNAAALPHLVDQLALVQANSPMPISGTDARRAALSTFVGGRKRRDRGDEESIFEQAAFVEIPPADSTAAVWVGDEIPIGANHGLLAGYANRHSHTRTGEAISVSIICNEQTMDGEAIRLNEIYQQRDDLPFETAIHTNVTTNRLRMLLAKDADFLHYIGHATSAGLECPDGTLDPITLDTCGATTFCLNACQSYLPATALIERGAIAGVATLGDIEETVAQGFGTATARLLNQGFSLRAAVFINRQASLLGGAYLALGDESVVLAETDGIVPYSIHLSGEEHPFQVSFRTYPSGRRGMGTYITTNLDDDYYLCNGEIGPFEPTEAAFEQFLNLHEAPVLYGDELLWSSDVSASDI
jgi:hypothetical protein